MPTLAEDFLNSAYWEALGTSIGNGLGVLVLITALAGIFTLISGGRAALYWESQRADADH